jgi:hypothetical protein
VAVTPPVVGLYYIFATKIKKLINRETVCLVFPV